MATCSNENRKTNCTNGLKPLVRNQYFYGKLLTVRDFQNEQSYHIKKQRLLNKHIHGEGVVCGLTVEKVDDNHIRIKSGIALDCCGREIIVPEDHIVDLAGKDDGVYWITVSYNECGKEPVAAATEANSCEEECCFSRVEEGYEIEILGTKPDICQSLEMKNICKTWSSVFRTDMGGKNSHELVNNFLKHEPKNNVHILEPTPANIFTPNMERREPFVTGEEFVKEYQGNCSLTIGEDNRVLLAKITLSDNNSISIDNALINGNSFDKKLIHTNPKLYELLKCTGKEEEETPITIEKISWPHAGSFTKGMFKEIASNGLEIIFSNDIECFNTNQCNGKSHFNVFPEVFKMEVLLFPNNEPPFLQELTVSGELVVSGKTLTFRPHEQINKIYEHAGSAMQVKITLNSNFIKGKDSNKPIYCGMYNFIVEGHTTALKSLNHTTTTGGKFESWFYVTSENTKLPDLMIETNSLKEYSKDDGYYFSMNIKNQGGADITKTRAKFTVMSGTTIIREMPIQIPEITAGHTKVDFSIEIPLGTEDEVHGMSTYTYTIKLNDNDIEGYVRVQEKDYDNNNYKIKYDNKSKEWTMTKIKRKK